MKSNAVNTIRLMVVAGEASGDAHAAALVRALYQLSPQTNFNFFGATGARMRAQSVESVVDTDKLSIMGLVEVTSVLPKFLSAYRKLKQAVIDREPHAVILIDWPEFNLRFARWLHRRGVRVVYYVSPQVWAWRSYRVRSIRRDVDLLLSILPFEKDWFAARGMTHVEYVGHPLAGHVGAAYDRAEFCRRHELDASLPIISLLPGSRSKELARILPPMLDAAAIISKRRSETQFVVVTAPNRDVTEAERIVANRIDQTSRTLRIVHHETREALAASDVAAIASGTATLEAALLGTPMVIVYKESFLNWHLLGSLINVDHYGLVNLIAGRRVATELFQTKLNGEALARELLDLLEPGRNRSFRLELSSLAEKLGTGNASREAAQMVLEFLNLSK